MHAIMYQHAKRALSVALLRRYVCSLCTGECLLVRRGAVLHGIRSHLPARVPARTTGGRCGVFVSVREYASNTFFAVSPHTYIYVLVLLAASAVGCCFCASFMVWSTHHSRTTQTHTWSLCWCRVAVVVVVVPTTGTLPAFCAPSSMCGRCVDVTQTQHTNENVECAVRVFLR